MDRILRLLSKKFKVRKEFCKDLSDSIFSIHQGDLIKAEQEIVVKKHKGIFHYYIIIDPNRNINYTKAHYMQGMLLGGTFVVVVALESVNQKRLSPV